MIRKIIRDKLKNKFKEISISEPTLVKNIWNDGGATEKKEKKKQDRQVVKQAKSDAFYQNIKDSLKNFKKYVPPPPPDTLCYVCKDPVYFYELKAEDPQICLWCERLKEV